jgi:hypothetical protein
MIIQTTQEYYNESLESLNTTYEGYLYTREEILLTEEGFRTFYFDSEEEIEIYKSRSLGENFKEKIRLITTTGKFFLAIDKIK